MKYFILYKLKVGMQICVQKAASGAIDKSDSHLTFGRPNVLSDFDIILYILESSFFEEDILISADIGRGRSRLIVQVSKCPFLIELMI